MRRLLVGCGFWWLTISTLFCQSVNPLQTARSLIDANKLAESETTLQNYLKEDPASADTHFLLGYVLFREGRAKESLAEFNAGAKLRTPGIDELRTVASDYVLLGDFSDADKWFSEVVRQAPQDANTWYLLGRTKYNENRFEEAIASFERALALHPKYLEAENNLGLCYQALDKNEQAQTAFQTAIEWQHDSPMQDPQPYLNLGILFLSQDQADKATPLLEKAATFAADNPRIHEELGQAYLVQNQLSKAQQQLVQAIALAPKVAALHFKLGQVYRREGRKDEAREQFDICAKLNSTHSSATTPNPFSPQ